MKLLTLRECIADFKDTIIRKTDDISRPGLINSALTLSHELSGRRESQCLSLTHMEIGHIALELT